MRENKRKTGSGYELLAREYLQKAGYNIVCTNYYCPMGEIDIIAEHENYLIFLEVKYRKTLKSGYPAEAVSFNKRKRIIRSAQFYCMKKDISGDTAMRFDVISVLGDEITHIKNAFDLNGVAW